MNVICEIDLMNNQDHPDKVLIIKSSPEGDNSSNFVRIVIEGVEYEVRASDVYAAVGRCSGRLD